MKKKKRIENHNHISKFMVIHVPLQIIIIALNVHEHVASKARVNQRV